MAVSLRILSCLILFSLAEPLLVHGDDDHDTLIGEWKVVALIARGRPDSGVSFQGMRYTFDEKTMTTIPGSTTPAGLAKKPPMKQEYKIDNSQKPKHLDIVFKGKKASYTMKTIYKIQDDKLHICMGRIGRPTTFDTTDTKNGCYIAERVSQPKVQPAQ